MNTNKQLSKHNLLNSNSTLQNNQPIISSRLQYMDKKSIPFEKLKIKSKEEDSIVSQQLSLIPKTIIKPNIIEYIYFRKDFILDGCSKNKVIFPEYNGLKDKYMYDYINNEEKKRFLLKMNLFEEANEETKNKMVIDSIIREKHGSANVILNRRLMEVTLTKILSILFLIQ